MISNVNVIKKNTSHTFAVEANDEFIILILIIDR